MPRRKGTNTVQPMQPIPAAEQIREQTREL